MASISIQAGSGDQSPERIYFAPFPQFSFGSPPSDNTRATIATKAGDEQSESAEAAAPDALAPPPLRPTESKIQVAPNSLKAATFDLVWESEIIRKTLRLASFKIQLLTTANAEEPDTESVHVPADISLIWSRKLPEAVFSQLHAGQTVNHIPGRHQIGHKDTLAMLMGEARRLFPSSTGE